LSQQLFVRPTITLTLNNKKNEEKQLKRNFETCNAMEFGRRSGAQLCLRTRDASSANGFLK